MSRIARLKVQNESAVYHIMSRTALDGFVIGDVEKQYLLKLIKKVNNDDGGLATPGDWNMTASATDNATRNINDFGNSSTFHPVFA